MIDCEKFTEILAAAAEASEAERGAAREHAAACSECRALAAAFEGVEASLAELTPTPAAFADRVVAALPLGEQQAATAPPLPSLPPLRRRERFPAWVVAGVTASLAAVIGGVLLYFGYADPEGLAAAATAFRNMPDVDITSYGVTVGSCAAAAIVAGFLAYYYVVPAE